MSSLAITPPKPKLALAAGPSSTLRAHLESALDPHLASTLLLRQRSAPLTVPTGIASLDALTGGLPRGALSEIAGPASSGRTGVMLAALAGATRRQEVCALVDASDSFDPVSAAAAGVDLDRLLWVRCRQSANIRERKRAGVKPVSATNHGFAFEHALEQVLKVTDLLLQGGGFGMVVLDLGDVPVASARRVPLASWFRFRRAVEPTATVLLLIEEEACAKTCASLVLRLQAEAIFASHASPTSAAPSPSGLQSTHTAHLDGLDKQAQPLFSSPAFSYAQHTGKDISLAGNSRLSIPRNNVVAHAALLRGMRFRAEVVRSSTMRKPPQSAATNFALRTADSRGP
jgi:recombination protein RecA